MMLVMMLVMALAMTYLEGFARLRVVERVIDHVARARPMRE